MKITIYVADNCDTCELVKNKLTKLLSEFPNYKLIVMNIKENNPKNLKIVPSVYVEDLLYSYGEFDYDKFNKRLANGYFEEGIKMMAS